MRLRDGTPTAIHLKDYTPPAFLIDTVDLDVTLGEDGTEVRARLALRRNPAAPHSDELALHGRKLELLSVAVDGKVLAEGTDYRVDAEHLIILRAPDACVVDIANRIHPETNTELEGLYKSPSSGMFCTQCEAEGFRKITYYLDRPDVMAKFSTTITADKQRYPVLLSNGNPVERTDLAGGLHRVRWEDPFLKPAYLFALVAGDLAVLEDSFRTKSGRDVALQIYTVKADIDKCSWAMHSLKESMAWDERVYGLEYDLDIFMIVAVGDFNMGAMENKGLNVFNTKYVLAKPETATDGDYQGIEAVIAHEYFHNWTGNRVTCRDWFQLSLKEGLTVFRDQQFSSDMGSPAVKRISDVRGLRAAQFPEDGGPMAHPVRPDSYIEINNFYTATVYQKGAEVVRMYHTLLGQDGFRAGMDLYFQRHDGQAVTCDDFLAAMQDASGVDLEQFRLWYSQAGTPEVTVSSTWDEAAKTFTVTVDQSCPPTPKQPTKQPFHIPLAIGLVSATGADMPATLQGENTAGPSGTRVLDIRKAREVFTFTGLAEKPTPSYLRGFSAPVKLKTDLADADLAFLMGHDGDAFARWEAGQQYGAKLMLEQVARRAKGQAISVDPAFIDAFAATIADTSLDKGLTAQAMALPSEGFLAEAMSVIDVDGIHEVREAFRKAITGRLRSQLAALYQANRDAGAYTVDAEAIARRGLKNAALAYLMADPDADARRLVLDQFEHGTNMTDQLVAFALIVEDAAGGARDRVVAEFHKTWRHDALVLDKWFSIQAMSTAEDALAQVKTLIDHPDFDIKNPNKVRSLIGAFASGNPVRFHAADGSGYRFLTDQLLTLDPINSKIAARLIAPLGRWKRYDPARGALMKGQLERIVSTSGLSRDTFELASKSLI